MTSTDDAADFFAAFVEPAPTAAPAPTGSPPAATVPPVATGRGRSRRRLLVVMAGVFVVTAVVTATVVRRGGDDLSSPPGLPLGSTAVASTTGPAGAPAATVAAPTTTGRAPSAPGSDAPSTVEVALTGGRIVLDGAVATTDQHDALVVGVRQMAGPGVEVDDRITVLSDEGEPAAVTIAVRVDDGVLFDLDSAAIQPGFQQLLAAVAAMLRLAPQASAVVVGHSDATGDELTNQALSQARADAVAAYLVANGIGEERVRAEGRGSQEPVAGNDTVEGRRANRRIEIQIEQ